MRQAAMCWNLFFDGPVPAPARHVGQGRGRFAGNKNLDIVHGRIGFAFPGHTQRIVHPMRPVVPALRGEVHATNKRKAFIDDDDLLVVRGANRM